MNQLCIVEENIPTQEKIFASYQSKPISKIVQAAFIAFIRISTRSPDNMEAEEKQQEDVKISLSGQKIFFVKIIKERIICCIDYCLNTKFQMSKSNQQTFGTSEPTGIKFHFREQDTQKILEIHCLIQQTQKPNLLKFYHVLQRKNVVQLGFHYSFKAIRRIGKGLTACIYEAIRLRDGKHVAIKSFKKSTYFQRDNGKGKLSFARQMKVLTLLNHRYMCGSEGVFETENSIYIIFELFPISLFGYICKKGSMSEFIGKTIIHKILLAIDNLHEMNIVHRDLKLDNVMLRDSSLNDPQPVIIDFGLAQYVNNQTPLYARCGTPGYIAPQILNDNLEPELNKFKLRKQSDVFSVGVIFYTLLTGKMVFSGSDVKEVLQRNKLDEINFQDATLDKLTPYCLDVLQLMLKRDPRERSTVKELLCHRYFGDEQLRLTNKDSIITGRSPISISIIP